MTETERDGLMGFLATLKQTRFPQYDKLAQTLVEEGLLAQPRAAYLLVHRCLVLQAELDQARRALAGAGLAAQAGTVQVWGIGESAWGINAGGSADDGASKGAQALGYLLRDAGTAQTPPYRSLEDKAVQFLGEHAGRVWLAIAAIAVLVVYWVK